MPGPKPNYEGIKKFQEYRKKKLSYREISKIMGKDLKTLSRWNKYVVGELSTQKDLTVGK